MSFTRGGSRIPRRRGAPDNKFARFSEKMHEMKKILVRWGVLGSPLDPPLFTILNCGVCHSKITLKGHNFVLWLTLWMRKRVTILWMTLWMTKRITILWTTKCLAALDINQTAGESYPILCTCFCNRNSIFKKTIRQWRNADSGIN